MLAAPAMAEDLTPLTITRVTPQQFPALKTKFFNSNFGLYGAAGNAVMRSRYGTDDGTDGERIFVYGYQLDLTATYDVIGHPGVTAVTLDIAKVPALATSPKLPDGTRLYVISESSDKAIGLKSAGIENGKLVFTFAKPLHAGPTSGGSGDHSLWFGLISTVAASRGDVLLTTLPVPKIAAQVPANPQPSPDAAAAQNPVPTLSIAEPKPVDPTVTPPLSVFVPVAPPPKPAVPPKPAAPAVPPVAK